MEKLKVKERERNTHRDIALGRCKDLKIRVCDKSKSYCRPLVRYPPVDVFRAERGGMSTQTVYLSHQKKKRVVLLSYVEAKNDPSALQAMEDGIASFMRFDCYEEVSADMVSVNANIISTRWVISKEMNDDCTWRSKARLVARDTRTKRKTECLQIPRSLRLRLSALLSPPRRLTLSAAMWLGLGRSLSMASCRLRSPGSIGSPKFVGHLD
jgi:hypothetical protein